MKRQPLSKRHVHAQRLSALAKGRSAETKAKHLRDSIIRGERRLANETDPRMNEYHARHLKGLRDKLNELLAQPVAPPSQSGGGDLSDAIVVNSPADLDARWMPLADAARRLGVDPGHLTRRCRQSLAARGLAARVALNGAPGPLRWFIARDLDERLAEAQSAITTTSGEGLKEGLKAV